MRLYLHLYFFDRLSDVALHCIIITRQADGRPLDLVVYSLGKIFDVGLHYLLC